MIVSTHPEVFDAIARLDTPNSEDEVNVKISTNVKMKRTNVFQVQNVQTPKAAIHASVHEVWKETDSNVVIGTNVP